MSNANPRLVEAMRLHVTGNLPQAAQAYQILLQEDPGNADAAHALGAIALQSQDYKNATQLFARAVELQPKNARFLHHLANAQLLDGSPNAGIDSLDKAIEASASLDNKMLADFIDACMENGRLHTAKARLDVLIEREPYEMLLRKLMVYVTENMGKPQEALPHFAMLLEADEEQPDVFFYNYAATLFDSGEKEEAARILALGLAQHPASSMLAELKSAM